MKIKDLKISVLPILKDAGVTKSEVFGSVARGEDNTKSDIDFLIEMDEESTLLDVVDLKYKLEDKLGRKVDLVTYRALSPLLKSHIDKDKIEIL